MSLKRIDIRQLGEIALPSHYWENVHKRGVGTYIVRSFNNAEKEYEVQVGYKAPKSIRRKVEVLGPRACQIDKFRWSGACTCEEWKKNKTTRFGKRPCKHIAAVISIMPIAISGIPRHIDY